MERLVSVFTRLYERFPYLGNLCFIDLETTGFEKDARLIEIGSIVTSFDGFEVGFHTFETLINPGMQISEKITEVTGITNDMLAEAESEAIYDSFVTWFKACNINKCIAHNASFDQSKLQNNLMRLGYDIAHNLPPFDCTMKLSRQFLTGPKNDKLKTLSEWYHFDNQQAHRALSDTEVCAYIYAKIMLGEYDE